MLKSTFQRVPHNSLCGLLCSYDIQISMSNPVSRSVFPTRFSRRFRLVFRSGDSLIIISGSRLRVKAFFRPLRCFSTALTSASVCSRRRSAIITRRKATGQAVFSRITSLFHKKNASLPPYAVCGIRHALLSYIWERNNSPLKDLAGALMDCRWNRDPSLHQRPRGWNTQPDWLSQWTLRHCNPFCETCRRICSRRTVYQAPT